MRVVEMVAEGNGTPDREEGEYLKGGLRCGTIYTVVSNVSWVSDRQSITSSEFPVSVQWQQFGWC